MTRRRGKALELRDPRRHSAAMAEDDPRTLSVRRLAPLACLLGGGLVLLALGAHRYLNFAALAANHEWACALVDRAPVLAALAFVAAYSGLVALSVPGAALLTMASGFLFGTCLGTTYAVLSATIGATIVFAAARTGLAGLAAKVGPQ